MARSVSVMQIPDELTREQRKAFLCEIQEATDTDHPNLVLDCSNVSCFDARTIRTLLLCLEGAMKRNGDIRLAHVRSEAMATLEQTGAARLFRIYNSSAEAVDSYHHPIVGPAPIEFARSMPV